MKQVSSKKHKQYMRRKPKKHCFVYALTLNNKIMYIGQTRLRLKDRLKWHYKAVDNAIHQKRKLSSVQKWINQCSMFCLPVEIIMIDENAIWNVTEIIQIERHRVSGHDLLNMTAGGES
jgi:hypothetical protein